MNYSAAIPSPALLSGRSKPRLLVRPAQLIAPVELALATTRSAGAGVIRDAFAGGQDVAAMAELIVSGGRFFATVQYGGGHEVFLPLDAWTLEARP